MNHSNLIPIIGDYKKGQKKNIPRNRRKNISIIKKLSGFTIKNQSLINIEMQNASDDKKEDAPDDKKEDAPDDKKEDAPDDKKQDASDDKKQDASDVKKQDASDVKKQDASDVKKQDASDVKKQDASDVKKQDTSDVEKQGASDVKIQDDSIVQKLDATDVEKQDVAIAIKQDALDAQKQDASDNVKQNTPNTQKQKSSEFKKKSTSDIREQITVSPMFRQRRHRKKKNTKKESYKNAKPCSAPVLQNWDKDLDEISDSPLEEQDDEEHNESLDDISDEPFDEMDIIDANKSDEEQEENIYSVNTSDEIEFYISFRTYQLKYLKYKQNFFKPKFFMYSADKFVAKCVSLQQGQEEFAVEDLSELMCISPEEKNNSKENDNAIEDLKESEENNTENLNASLCQKLETLSNTNIHTENANIDLVKTCRHGHKMHKTKSVNKKQDSAKNDETEKEIKPESLENEERLEQDTVDNDDIIQGKAQIQEDIDRMKDSLIGLEYIVEIWQKSKLEVRNYRCFLCSEALRKTAVITHVASLPHRLAYLEKHFPAYSAEFLQFTCAWNKTLKASLDQYCKEVEKKYGRLQVFITNISYYLHHLKDIQEKISKAFHFDEKNCKITENAAEEKVKDEIMNIEDKDRSSTLMEENNSELSQGKALIQEDIDGTKDPLIGLEYIVEIWHKSKREVRNYRCFLCSEALMQATVITHVTNMPHRLAYFAKHFPDYGSKFPQKSTCIWDKDLKASLEQHCKEIEDKYGRLQIFITNHNYYLHHLKIIQEKLDKSFHFAKKDYKFEISENATKKEVKDEFMHIEDKDESFAVRQENNLDRTDEKGATNCDLPTYELNVSEVSAEELEVSAEELEVSAEEPYNEQIYPSFNENYNFIEDDLYMNFENSHSESKWSEPSGYKREIINVSHSKLDSVTDKLLLKVNANLKASKEALKKPRDKSSSNQQKSKTVSGKPHPLTKSHTCSKGTKLKHVCSVRSYRKTNILETSDCSEKKSEAKCDSKRTLPSAKSKNHSEKNELGVYRKVAHSAKSVKGKKENDAEPVSKDIEILQIAKSKEQQTKGEKKTEVIKSKRNETNEKSKANKHVTENKIKTDIKTTASNENRTRRQRTKLMATAQNSNLGTRGKQIKDLTTAKSKPSQATKLSNKNVHRSPLRKKTSLTRSTSNRKKPNIADKNVSSRELNKFQNDVPRHKMKDGTLCLSDTKNTADDLDSISDKDESTYFNVRDVLPKYSNKIEVLGKKHYCTLHRRARSRSRSISKSSRSRSRSRPRRRSISRSSSRSRTRLRRSRSTSRNRIRRSRSKTRSRSRRSTSGSGSRRSTSKSGSRTSRSRSRQRKIASLSRCRSTRSFLWLLQRGAGNVSRNRPRSRSRSVQRRVALRSRSISRSRSRSIQRRTAVTARKKSKSRSRSTQRRAIVTSQSRSRSWSRRVSDRSRSRSKRVSDRSRSRSKSFQRTSVISRSRSRSIQRRTAVKSRSRSSSIQRTVVTPRSKSRKVRRVSSKSRSRSRSVERRTRSFIRSMLDNKSRGFKSKSGDDLHKTDVDIRKGIKPSEINVKSARTEIKQSSKSPLHGDRISPNQKQTESIPLQISFQHYSKPDQHFSSSDLFSMGPSSSTAKPQSYSHIAANINITKQTEPTFQAMNSTSFQSVPNYSVLNTAVSYPVLNAEIKSKANQPVYGQSDLKTPKERIEKSHDLYPKQTVTNELLFQEMRDTVNKLFGAADFNSSQTESLTDLEIKNKTEAFLGTFFATGEENTRHYGEDKDIDKETQNLPHFRLNVGSVGSLDKNNSKRNEVDQQALSYKRDPNYLDIHGNKKKDTDRAVANIEDLESRKRSYEHNLYTSQSSATEGRYGEKHSVNPVQYPDTQDSSKWRVLNELFKATAFQEWSEKQLKANTSSQSLKPNMPNYKEEWEKFFKAKLASLFKAGKNPNTYDFEGEWLKHWESLVQKSRLPYSEQHMKDMYKSSSFSLMPSLNNSQDIKQQNLRQKAADLGVLSHQTKPNLQSINQGRHQIDQELTAIKYPDIPISASSVYHASNSGMRNIMDKISSDNPKMFDDKMNTSHQDYIFPIVKQSPSSSNLSRTEYRNIASPILMSQQVTKGSSSSYSVESGRPSMNDYASLAQSFTSSQDYSPTQNMQKISLAQRLASVLVKLGMTDIPGSLLSEMLIKIGAFSTSSVEDISESQIISILQRYGYVTRH